LGHPDDLHRIADPIRVRLQLFAEERTETATPRRRQEARRKGQVARSAELGPALIIMAVCGVLYLWTPLMARETLRFARMTYSQGLNPLNPLTAGDVSALFIQMIVLALWLVGPVVGAVLIVGVAAQILQVGFLTAGDPLKPQLQRINPISGFKRIFSKRALVEFAKAILKVTIVSTIVFLNVRREIAGFAGFAEIDPVDAWIMTGRTLFSTGLSVGVALLVLAAFDYAYQRWEFEQSIKMTKKEVKEEARQMEGDPQIRAKIRQRQRQIATMRMMQAVPRAEVVITNPVHVAVALEYRQQEMDAPSVAAKGAGVLAERIKSVAREHRVPVVENPALARALYETVPIGAAIPEELYQAVAEVLAFVYRLRRA